MLKKNLQNIPKVNRLISNTWWYTELALSNLLIKKHEIMNMISAFIYNPRLWNGAYSSFHQPQMGADLGEHIFVSRCKMQLNNGLFWGNGTEQGPQCSTCPLWPEGHVASSLLLNVSLSYWNRDSHWVKVQCLRSCSRTNNNSIPAVCWIILSPWLVKYHEWPAGGSQNLYYSARACPLVLRRGYVSWLMNTCEFVFYS